MLFKQNSIDFISWIPVIVSHLFRYEQKKIRFVFMSEVMDGQTNQWNYFFFFHVCELLKMESNDVLYEIELNERVCLCRNTNNQDENNDKAIIFN